MARAQWASALALVLPMAACVAAAAAAGIYFRDPDGHLLELATPGVWSMY